MSETYYASFRFVVELLLAAAVYVAPLPRKKGFVWKLLLGITVSISASILLGHLIQRNLFLNILRYIVLFLLVAVLLHLCFELDRYGALFCAVSAYATQHFMIKLFYLIQDVAGFPLGAEIASYLIHMEALTAGRPETGVETLSVGPQKAEPLTVGEWMDRWLEKYAKPTVKLSTYCSYEQLIRGHIKPQIGGRYMNTLTGEDLQDFFNERRRQGNLRCEGGLSQKTLTNLRNMMHLAFDQAVKNKMLMQNLLEGVRLPKAEKHEMRVLDREEQIRLTLAARRAPEPAAFGIIFDLFTGLRMGELCGLRWENVDMDSHSFKVCETRNRLPNFDDSIETSTSVKTVRATKTDNSRRTVFIMDGLYQDFVDYRTMQMSLQKQNPGYNPDGYVFCQESGQPYEPRTYQDLFKRCVRRAGIPDANFHSLRHTFATRALEQGMDVVTLSRLLGHATPSVTLDKYGHALNDHKRASVEKLGGIYNAGRGIPRSQER